MLSSLIETQLRERTRNASGSFWTVILWSAGGTYRVRDSAGLGGCNRFKLDPRCEVRGSGDAHQIHTQRLRYDGVGGWELAQTRLHFPFCVCFLLFRRSKCASITSLSSGEMILSSLSLLKSVRSGKSRAIVHPPLPWGTLLGSTLSLTQPWK